MLRYYSPETLQTLTQQRPGETKLGQTISPLSSLTQLENHPARFVLLGIEEDIGIRANLGKAGADEAWHYFLPAFLNVQDNAFLSGRQIAVAGYLAFPDEMQQAATLNPSRPSELEQLRQLCAEIDNQVSETVQAIAQAGKIPVVIGGGHNNAYGLIKGVQQALKAPLSVLNIDPHADYRALEGRHSGNGFSYAHQQKLMNRYAVFGLHESYNNAAILEQFHNRSDLYYLSFDELLTFSTAERDRLFKDVLNWLGNQTMGLELDLDALTHFPASAYNTSGFTMRQARLMVKTAAALKKPRYFHLAEASPGLAADENAKKHLGKSLAYLATDFIKSWN